MGTLARIMNRVCLMCGLFVFGLAFADDKPPVALYSQQAAYSGLSLSPDGHFVAAIMNTEGEEVVGIYELPITEDSSFWVRKYERGKIDWLRWANDDRLLVSVTFTDRNRGIPFSNTRLIAIDHDGENPVNMVKRPPTQLQFFDQHQSDILSLLPEDKDHILMAFNKDVTNIREPEIRLVNVYNGSSKLLGSSESNISDWVADRDGVVRVGYGLHDKKIKMIFRDDADSDWVNVSDRFQPGGAEEFDDRVVFDVLGFDEDPDILYILSNHETDTAAVYRYSIKASEFTDKVYGRSDVDISGLQYDSTGREVVGVRYIDDEPRIHYLAMDQDSQIRQQVSNLLGGAGIYLQSMTYDNMLWVLSVSDVKRPREFYLLDKRGGGLKLFGKSYPGLTEDLLSEVHEASYPARDDLEIPAFVTLPPEIKNLEDASQLPFIILPHGGPGSRDFKRFDFLSQFLASRGYGVLQMNYRGSTGYGTSFQLAGNKQWGQAMQDDITDGVEWLVEEGYADSDRLCIVGWSYGAYAALIGSVKTPDLYQCAVGIAGVYDLQALVRNARNRYENGEFITRHIGRLWSDEDLLIENSPNRRAGEIAVPVLLVHAADDTVAHIGQSELMSDALKAADKEYQYLEFETGGHSLVTDARTKMMVELEKFLDQHL